MQQEPSSAAGTTSSPAVRSTVISRSTLSATHLVRSYKHPLLVTLIICVSHLICLVANNTKPAYSESLLTFRIWLVCCHSNETHALIANPPNTAQERTPYHSSKLHPGAYSSVKIRRETHTHTDMAVITRHFAWLCQMQNVNTTFTFYGAKHDTYLKV